MFTAIVLICGQEFCFATGGPAFETREQCVADFIQFGANTLKSRYPGYVIAGVECHEWKMQEADNG